MTGLASIALRVARACTSLPYERPATRTSEWRSSGVPRHVYQERRPVGGDQRASFADGLPALSISSSCRKRRDCDLSPRSPGGLNADA